MRLGECRQTKEDGGISCEENKRRGYRGRRWMTSSKTLIIVFGKKEKRHVQAG